MPLISCIKLARKGAVFYVKERLMQAQVNRITCTDDIRRLLSPLSCGEAFECTWAIYLDRHKDVIALSKVAVGDSRGTYMSPELFVRQGIMLVEVTGIVTAHNHIWDPAEPGADDLACFTELATAFEFFEWEYVDNVILSPNDFYSFRERGHFPSSPIRRSDTKVSAASKRTQIR
jgi:DNA repair protein RadC